MLDLVILMLYLPNLTDSKDYKGKIRNSIDNSLGSKYPLIVNFLIICVYYYYLEIPFINWMFINIIFYKLYFLYYFKNSIIYY